MPDKIYVYRIEAIFENVADNNGRVDTHIINMESQDFFIAVNQLIDDYYPAKLLELHLELVIDEDEDNG